jgi:xylulose-5-phosphate/fructose-6-phosphate phosphoketolase
MPGEVIDRPNPRPLDSSVPDSVLFLSVKLEKFHIGENDIQALQDFRRASNYIAASK